MQEMKKLMTDKNINWNRIKKMKIFFMITAFLLLGFMHGNAQDLSKDVLEKYQYGNSLEKYNVIKSYLNTFNKNENILIKQSLELIDYFKKQNDYTGVDCGNVFLAFRAYDKHNYTTALNIALPTFSSFKTRSDTAGILMITRVIDYSYYATKNYAEAVKYMKELIPIYIAQKNKQGLNFIYNEIGSVYGKAFQPDSGLIFAQQSLNLAYELNNNNLITSSLATIAENYIAKGDYDLAMPFLKKATKQYKITFAKNDSLIIYTWFNNDYAQAYLAMKEYDSAIYYAHRSLEFSIKSNDIVQQLRTYEYLYKSFDKIGKQDSSNKYYRLAGTIKDSLLGSEKVKSIEAATFSALLRQQEIDSENIKNENERKQNIQFVLIVLGIIIFIVVFILLSHSVIVTEKWISFFGILGLLIVFEFINLLIHPFIEQASHHSPLLMLIALVAIALLLIPIHHRLEKWIKEKMTEKNKNIRLENAKKTIEKLEGKTNN